MDQDLISELQKKIKTVSSLAELKKEEVFCFGKNGAIKALLAKIGQSPAEKRKEMAIKVQEVEKKVRTFFETKQKELQQKSQEFLLAQTKETINPQVASVGHLHPITETIQKLNDFFSKMGFSVLEDREIETDEYCFRRLNVPADHPARDMQDTIYVESPDYLLRTQTSSIEARLLEKFPPPLKVVSPGRVYRNEKPNPSNHFIFHHYQGVVVSRDANLKDLFGTFSALFSEMYGPKVKIRYRNKYYPEVEPGVGPDMQCFNCAGRGCAVCKGVGWIEMGGAGIIHPNIMKMAGLDTKEWRGFAFGLGLDRWVMARYNIKDIRTLLGGDLGYKPKLHENPF